MEVLEELESKIRLAGITPIKQIASIRLGTKTPAAWDSLAKIGKKISDGWKLKESSWQIVSESRR